MKYWCTKMNTNNNKVLETDLYRFYDKDGVLLYIGISCSFIRRMSQHKSNKDWWNRVAIIKRQPIFSRSMALKVEADAIRNEHPLFNLAGTENNKNRNQIVINFHKLPKWRKGVVRDKEQLDQLATYKTI